VALRRERQHHDVRLQAGHADRRDSTDIQS
jgi:hypothetical protein